MVLTCWSVVAAVSVAPFPWPLLRWADSSLVYPHSGFCELPIFVRDVLTPYVVRHTMAYMEFFVAAEMSALAQESHLGLKEVG